MKTDSNFIPASPLSGVLAGSARDPFGVGALGASAPVSDLAVADRPAADADAGRLVKSAKSDETKSPSDLAKSRHAVALSRVFAKDKAADLVGSLPAASPIFKAAGRLAACGVNPVASVKLHLNEADRRAHYSGLQRCANVWLCACCSPRIAAARCSELVELLDKSQAAGLYPVLLTLTASHDKDMKCAWFLGRLKRAKRRLHQLSAWRKLPVEGHTTTTEVTHGNNGFHVHYHCVVLMALPEGQAIDAVDGLLPSWLASLEKFGLSGNSCALHVQGATSAGAYAAGFSAAAEVSLSGSKSARAGSRTLWQVLNDARDGCKKSSAIWLEYAQAFRGVRQLSWSAGLKARFSIGEVSDAQAASAEPAEAGRVVVLRSWSSEEWRSVRFRRQSLLLAAELGSCLDAAAVGPSDFSRWLHDYGGGASLRRSSLETFLSDRFDGPALFELGSV